MFIFDLLKAIRESGLELLMCNAFLICNVWIIQMILIIYVSMTYSNQ